MAWNSAADMPGKQLEGGRGLYVIYDIRLAIDDYCESLVNYDDDDEVIDVGAGRECLVGVVGFRCLWLDNGLICLVSSSWKGVGRGDVEPGSGLNYAKRGKQTTVSTG